MTLAEVVSVLDLPGLPEFVSGSDGLFIGLEVKTDVVADDAEGRIQWTDLGQSPRRDQQGIAIGRPLHWTAQRNVHSSCHQELLVERGVLARFPTAGERRLQINEAIAGVHKVLK